jgi:type IV pilus assembly protein PilO
MSSGTASTHFREQLRSPLTWHYIGFAALLLVVIGLGIRLGLDWRAINSDSDNALAAKQIQLRASELQTSSLRGLDKRVEETRAQMQSFFSNRIPPSYSAVSGRLGELEVASGVRLSRVQYTQGISGPDLTEISVDTTISGDYPQIMRFINSLERDQTFFLIRAMTLAGQQGGQVNLRLAFSTWMRRADAASSGLPTQQAAEQSPAGTEAR